MWFWIIVWVWVSGFLIWCLLVLDLCGDVGFWFEFGFVLLVVVLVLDLLCWLFWVCVVGLVFSAGGVLVGV